MRWLNFLTRHRDSRSDAGDTLDRYKELRKRCCELNVILAQRLPRTAVPECGKKLGLVKSGTLILNNDDEIAVVYDYCIHHFRRGGRTEVERYLDDTTADAHPADTELLQALRDAWFSLFRVDEISPRRGARVCDLVSGKHVDVIDSALIDTASPGTIVAGRLIPLSDFTMSTGVLIPVPEHVVQNQIEPVIRTFFQNPPKSDGRGLAPAQEAAFAARTLRIALHASGEDNVFFSDNL
jgi:hypothetical protein